MKSATLVQLRICLGRLFHAVVADIENELQGFTAAVSASSRGSRNRWWERPSSQRPQWVRCGEGVLPSPREKGSREGAVPPPHNFFSILNLKMVSFGALWDSDGGMHPPSSLCICHCQPVLKPCLEPMQFVRRPILVKNVIKIYP